MAEEMLSYSGSNRHDAFMITRLETVLMLPANAGRLARTRSGVTIVKFGHLDTVR
jgi:hypothetical protein